MRTSRDLGLLVLVGIVAVGAFGLAVLSLPSAAAHDLCIQQEPIPQTDGCEPKDCEPGTNFTESACHAPDLGVDGFDFTEDPDEGTDVDTIVDLDVAYANNHFDFQSQPQANAWCPHPDENEQCEAVDPFDVGVVHTTGRVEATTTTALRESLTTHLYGTFTRATHDDLPLGPGGNRGNNVTTVSMGARLSDLGLEAGHTVTVFPIVDFCNANLDGIPDEPAHDSADACTVAENDLGNSNTSEVNTGPGLRFLVHPLPVAVGMAPSDPPAADLAENMEATFTVAVVSGASFPLQENYTLEVRGPGGDRLPIAKKGEVPDQPRALTYDGRVQPIQALTSFDIELDTAGLPQAADLTVNLTYADYPAGAPNPVVNPDFVNNTQTFQIHRPDFVPAISADPGTIDPTTSDQVDLNVTVDNVGQADADAVDHGPVEVTVEVCNQLKELTACEDDGAAGWSEIPGSPVVVDPADLPAAGSTTTTVAWDPGSDEKGLYRVRATVDEAGQYLQSDIDNDRDVTAVGSSRIEVQPLEATQQVTQPRETVTYALTLTNADSQDHSFTIFRHIRSAMHVCSDETPDSFSLDCGDWDVTVLTTDFRVLHEGAGDLSPTEINVGEGRSRQILVNVTAPDPDHFQGDNFARLMIAACRTTDAGPTSCTQDNDVDGSGALLTTEIPAVHRPSIRVAGLDAVQADPGDTVDFAVRVQNDGNIQEPFRLNATLAADSNQQATVRVLDSTGSTDNVTGDVPVTKRSDRFRVRIEVDEAISDGEIIEVNLTATTIDVDPAATASRTLTVGIGVDVVPPQVTATGPKDGAVVQPGTELTFDITDDDSGLNTVSVSINGRSFSAFEAPFVLNTSGQPDGPMTVRIKAVDKTGNSADRKFTFHVDGTPPRFQALEVLPKVVYAGGPFDIVVSLDEPNPASVDLEVESRTVELARGNASGSPWRAHEIAAPSAKGLYNLRVVATDGAGNVKNTTVDLEVVEPDVKILADDVLVDPRAPREDQATVIKVKVTNPSQARLGDYPVALIVDGGEFARKTVDVPKNGKAQVSFQWSGSPGDHDATLVADPDDAFADPAPGNNEHAFTITVRGRGLLGIPGFETIIIAAALVLGALGWRRWDVRDQSDP